MEALRLLLGAGGSVAFQATAGCVGARLGVNGDASLISPLVAILSRGGAEKGRLEDARKLLGGEGSGWVDSHQFGTTTRVLRTGESADKLEKNKKVALVVGLVRYVDETCRQLAELTAQWNSQPSHEDLMLLEHGQSRDETRRKQREAAAALAEREAPRMKAAMAQHEDLMLLEFGQSRAETQRKQREAAAATAEREARRYARSVAEEEVPPPPPQQQRGKTPAVASPLEQLTELLYSFHSPAVASAVTPHAAATGATQPAASTLPLAAYAPQPWATRPADALVAVQPLAAARPPTDAVADAEAAAPGAGGVAFAGGSSFGVPPAAAGSAATAPGGSDMHAPPPRVTPSATGTKRHAPDTGGGAAKKRKKAPEAAPEGQPRIASLFARLNAGDKPPR